jgi:hypothetical protein
MSRIVQFDPLPGSRGALSVAPGADMPRRSLIQFKSPSELRSWQEPEDFNLLSHRILSRGDITTLTGPPGTGKSRAALWLAVQLAEGTGRWFHYQIDHPFRVLMIQDENNEARLASDMKSFVMLEESEERLRISLQPDCAMLLEDEALVGDLCVAAADHKPDLLIVDPWNAVIRDDTAAGFSIALKGLRKIASAAADANGGKRPAILILHHPRKLREGDQKKQGRDLSELMAGSYQLFSKSRAGLYLFPVASDINETRVILSIAKASNHRKGKDEDMPGRSAWEMVSDGFRAIEDFNWPEFDGGGSAPREKITLEDIRAVFRGEDGRSKRLAKAAIVKALLARCPQVSSKQTAYDALGRFGEWLMEDASSGTWAYVGTFGD